MTDARKLGLVGEMKAANYLRDNGYIIIDANYRCKAGEIDIIAYKNQVMCFVEVKTRTAGQLFSPRESVDKRKEENVKSSAANFAARYKVKNKKRFDIIEVVYDDGSFTCNHIKNAF